MKTLHKKILTALLLILVILTSTAQAGMMDRLTSSKVDQGAPVGSFDQLYASTMTSGQDSTAMPILDTANALVAVSSPVGSATKVFSKTYTVQVSGYSSEVRQTDASPFITAAGTHVRDGIVAANIINASGYNIPLYTIVKIKECGPIKDKIYVVEDRMNKRYTKNVDIWFAEKSDAISFGRKTCQVEILK